VKAAALLCLLCAPLAALASPAGSGATSEAQRAYAARVEPICRAGTQPIESLLHGTRRMANHGGAVAAGRRFVRASGVFGGVVRKVRRVKPPAGDAQRIAKWVERLGNVKEAMRRVGLALKQRNKLKALNRSGQLRDAGSSANKAVAGLHFHYCHIYDSRFS
jgi:hypothetical protein